MVYMNKFPDDGRAQAEKLQKYNYKHKYED
jgi:hypothetical protein